MLFAVLAALILFGGQYLTSKFFPTANPPVTKITDGKSVPVSSAPVTTPAKMRDRNQVLGETQRVKIVTPLLNGSINLKGARIDDLVLPTYKETIDKNSAPIRLFSPSGTENAYFASFGWAGDGVQVPGADTVFTASAPELSPGKPVTLSWASPSGQRFAIQIAVDDKFMFTVTQQVANASAAPVKVQPFAAVSRHGPGADVTTATNHVGPIGVFGSGADYDIDYTNLDGKEAGFFGKIFGNHAKPGENHFDTKGGWVGFGDKYWLAALIPDQNAALKSGFPAASGGQYQADIALNAVTVAPGKALSTTTRLFAGDKEVATLNGYA
ncbi:MAG: rane protein insertase YidC, partial [Sphingomonas bacterium]|nr:rane protein insertase YidC [Sphingomonas bacterium]